MVDDAAALLRESRDSLRVVREFGPTERRRRSEIAAVARVMASRDGYKGVTIRQVAAEAGTTPVTVYRYFGSKDGLVQHLMAEWALDTLDRITRLPATSGAGPAERVAGAFAQLIDWAAEDRNLLHAGMSSVHSGDGPGIRVWRPLFTELVRAALTDPDWTDDHDRALILGHVLTTCLLDLTTNPADITDIRRTITRAAHLLFAPPH
ncbi:TetR/AcrR family transcriptional regulator [Nocardia speluncae]|uniref:TetR/AcrR family transcriptional regulator n=1 Tax=Nocardia speluncae TaxID=419477 RepID=A0A846XSM1_9NOCA|nr:TetR/AcrR family transcriptional regulator [Nocardia speluncae]NKY36574.1 TetR/AcrR family transcriptional regulator [Nocardia speluncae]